jgi:plasmid stabilization system protein ParE
MPRGDKSAYTDKQKRKAEHIAEGYEERGVGHDEAEARAWATVNKQDGGGKQSGSGRAGNGPDASRRRSEAAKRAQARRSPEERSASARKAAATRKARAPS